MQNFYIFMSAWISFFCHFAIGFSGIKKQGNIILVNSFEQKIAEICVFEILSF